MPKLLDAFQSAFPSSVSNGCLSKESNSLFAIFDPPAEQNLKCEITLDTTKGQFHVNNPKQEELYFLAIDKCLFDSKNDSRCDCALFNDLLFYFIEIKDVKTNKRAEARKKAISQLEETIKQFQEKVDFTNIQKIAIVALTFEKDWPVAKPRKQNDSFLFELRYKSTLCEGNSLTFGELPVEFRKPQIN